MPHRAAFAVLLWIGVLTALPGSLPAQVPAERDPTAWPTDGPWDGRRIPPEDWAAASTARRIDPVNDAGWAYGYQWWRIDRRNVEVWADLGYGGQFLAILPAHGVVGLVNSWNLFGDGQSGILGPFLDALIDASRPVLRVMSYNVRYGTADDGPNSWEHRRDLALSVIAAERPHVIGVQEALRFQLDEIRAAFPYLAETGVGRDDGAEAGEYSAILYDRRRFELLEGDTFWLSDTPETVASTSWGNRIPRIVTWARFRDRRAGRAFYVYNTHWDHESQPSRERSSALLARRIAGRAQTEDPVLVTGDFNAGERNPARETLAEAGFEDTFRTLHPDADLVGTFHGFEGDRSGEKIDAVLAGPGWEVREARIVRLRGDGRYPSDHFPVIAAVVPVSEAEEGS